MPKLLIARHISGQMIDIKVANRGLACNCICECCGEQLIARKGNVKRWSFAHEGGSNCSGAIESALHRAAKQIVEEDKTLYIGEYDSILSVNPDFYSLLTNTINNYYKELEFFDGPITETFSHFVDKELVDRVLNAQRRCRTSSLILSSAKAETKAEGSLRRPDITATTLNGNQLYVEFVVAHECDEEKRTELRKLEVPTIQIDLSPLTQTEFTMDDVRDAIVNGNLPSTCSDNIKYEWLVKPKYIEDAEAIANEFTKTAISKFNLLKTETEARNKKVTGPVFRQESDNETSHLQAFSFLRAIIQIEQKDTNAIVSCIEPGLADGSIAGVMKGLNARPIKGGWVIDGKSVKSTLTVAFRHREQEILNKSAEESYLRQQNVHNDSKSHEDYLKKSNSSYENNFSEEERQTAVRIENRAKENYKKTAISTNRQKQLSDIEKATKSIIAKHSGIVDYRWRRMKINEELLSLGYPLLP